MATILIVESNTPDLVMQGQSAATGFTRTIDALSPETILTVVAPYNEAMPESAFDGVDGVIFTGSGVSWSTAASEAQPLQVMMERVFERGLPTYGSCNGLQLAATVLGGDVGTSPNGNETGVARDLRLSEAGRVHPFMAGRYDGYSVPCIHRDEVQRLPDGAVLLAGNAHSPVQAMAYELGGVRFWGVQYHPELSAQDIACILRSKGGTEGSGLTSDLEKASDDVLAAARIGTTPTALALPERSLELANWVMMVSGKRA